MAGGKGEKKGVKRQKKGASPEKRAKVEKDTPPPPPPPPPRTPSPELTEEERKDLKRRFKNKLFQATVRRVRVGRSPFSEEERQALFRENVKKNIPRLGVERFDDFHAIISQHMKALRSHFKGKKSGRATCGPSFSLMSFFFMNLFPEKSMRECSLMEVDEIAPLFYSFLKKARREEL